MTEYFPVAVHTQGQVLTGDQLAEVAAGLEENHLLEYDYLLTGFIGNEQPIVFMLLVVIVCVIPLY